MAANAEACAGLDGFGIGWAAGCTDDRRMDRVAVREVMREAE